MKKRDNGWSGQFPVVVRGPSLASHSGTSHRSFAMEKQRHLVGPSVTGCFFTSVDVPSFSAIKRHHPKCLENLLRINHNSSKAW